MVVGETVYEFDKRVARIRSDDFSRFVLGADVGGENTRLAVAGLRGKKPVLLFSLRFETRSLGSFLPAAGAALRHAEKEGLKVSGACFAAAGRVSEKKDFCRLTNSPLSVSSEKAAEKFGLGFVRVINDFEAAGYGLNLLEPRKKSDLLPLPRLSPARRVSLSETRALVGAGTGLGKSVLRYDSGSKLFVPFPSEGGHVDFPVRNRAELELLEFVKKSRGLRGPVSYEHVLSGSGLGLIYSFLIASGQFEENSLAEQILSAAEKAPRVSEHRSKDPACRKAFSLWASFYARCAKNFVLETLATGGVYLAGGIALKNPSALATGVFVNEFENAGKQKSVLKNTPVYVVMNPDVGLLGACLAAAKQI